MAAFGGLGMDGEPCPLSDFIDISRPNPSVHLASQSVYSRIDGGGDGYDAFCWKLGLGDRRGGPYPIHVGE